MARIGYARVSTTDQDHALQEARLKEAGCEIIRSEKASGKTRAGRDELASVVEFIRAGDELVVVKLDRLGRSTRDVLNLVHELEARGAALTVLDPAFRPRIRVGLSWSPSWAWSRRWSASSSASASKLA
jgi:DNA invertase Pin-like site-specific DNA recombinase